MEKKRLYLLASLVRKAKYYSRLPKKQLECMQDVTMPAVAAMGKGCKWNQDLTSLLAQAQLSPVKLQTSLAGVVTLLEARKT